MINREDTIRRNILSSMTNLEKAKTYPNLPSGGQWKTINGAKVYVHNGKVVAGADGKLSGDSDSKSSNGGGDLTLTSSQKSFLEKFTERNPKISTDSIMSNYAKVVKKTGENSLEVFVESLQYLGDKNRMSEVNGDDISRMLNGSHANAIRAERSLELGLGGSNSKEDIEVMSRVGEKFSKLNKEQKLILKTAISKIIGLDEDRSYHKDLLKIEKLLNDVRIGDYDSAVNSISKHLIEEKNFKPSVKKDARLEKEMNVFREVAKKSKNPEDFINRARKIKGVSAELSKYFSERYIGDGGTLHGASERFFAEVNKNKQ